MIYLSHETLTNSSVERRKVQIETRRADVGERWLSSSKFAINNNSLRREGVDAQSNF